jgi:hypothetical protein
MLRERVKEINVEVEEVTADKNGKK